MTRHCICQLCICGRHKCDLHPKPGPPCGDNCISEYRNVYTRKPYVETKSFKPDQVAVQSDAPAEDKTTNRCDYVRHPIERPKSHNPDPYLPPQGVMDGLSSYRKEYTRKPINKVLPAKPKQRRVPGAFDGNTNNRIDFQKWPIVANIVRPPDVYMPPADPFDSTSSYRTAYLGPIVPPRPSMKPDTVPHLSDAPLDDLTTSRAAYVRHPIAEPEMKIKEPWLPNPAQLDGLTNYRKDFNRKNEPPRASFKPDSHPVQSDAPFVGATTQRCDYLQWPTKPPELHNPDPYMPPIGEVSKLTTNRVDFDRKPLNPAKAWRPKDRRAPAGEFDNTTTNRVDFRNWGRVERPSFTMKDVYKPLVEPFDGMATYTSAYIRHNEKPRPSMKPDRVPVQSDAPLQDNTEYRGEFTRKIVDPCVAGALQAGKRCGGHLNLECYKFIERDGFGHSWYEPDQSTPPGLPVA